MEAVWIFAIAAGRLWKRVLREFRYVMYYGRETQIVKEGVMGVPPSQGGRAGRSWKRHRQCTWVEC